MRQWFEKWVKDSDELLAFVNRNKLVPGEVIIISSNSTPIGHSYTLMYYAEGGLK